MTFADKVIVITGAGSGIGRALAQAFASEGARLALSDINEDGLQDTLMMLPKACETRAYTLDVSSREAVFAHAAEVQRDFGAVDYLINNAGATLVGTIAHTSIEEFEWQLGINLWGVIYGTKAFLPDMLKRGQGCIVNISSVFGLIGFPLQGAYNISKFGVRGFTECLWAELQDTGVSAVCVHPGGIKTGIEKAGRRVQNAGVEEEAFAQQGDAMLKTTPVQCAAQILQGLRKGQRRILTGHLARTIFWLARLLPNVYPNLLKRLVK